VLVAADFDAMCACGFSARKIATIEAIAHGAIAGVVPSRAVATLMDDEVSISGAFPARAGTRRRGRPKTTSSRAPHV
jgi:hypothetical protein